MVAGAALAGCSDDDDPQASTSSTTESSATTTTTTAPERQASTTTTAHDPSTVEGQVEAAYLRSWDVYADAVYDLELDEAALAEVYAERSLQTRRSEIEERVSDGRAAHVRIDHDYEIVVVDENTAAVIDNFTNHQVLVDPETKEPIEPDPNEKILVNFQLKRLDGMWKVTLIQRVGE